MQTINLVRTLVDGGYQVMVCCYYDHAACMVAAMEVAGGCVVLMGLARSDGLWHLFGKLKRFFRDERPDIVHVQYIAPGLIPILAARLARVATVFATVHQPGRTYGCKAKLLLRGATQLCAAFFCISHSVEKSWFGSSAQFNPQHVSSRKHWTIYNAVDGKRIFRKVAETDRTALRANLDLWARPVLGIVGRLRWEKGQSVLLDAMATVLEKIPSALLLVVGDGPDREDLHRQTMQLGIMGSLRWLGQQNSDNVFQLYSIMDVLVVPSIFEGFGLVAAEAMAAGLPVVGTAVDGLAEVIVDNETGRLVPAQDSAALVDALVSLLSSPATATEMGRKGQQRVAELFSLQIFSESTLAAYAAFHPSTKDVKGAYKPDSLSI